jgi:predicted extracellular nuclease
MPQTPNELFISEYGEGSSNNKWLEIYNGTGAAIDLSNYSIEYYNNGATVVTQTFVLSGTLAAGDVYILTTDAAAQSIQDLADEIFAYPSVVHYNGDDAVALLHGTEIIDLIGIIGEDPGSSWPVGDGATAEYTLVRNQSTFGPNATFTASEWDVYPQDTFDYIGSHTLVTGVATDAMIVNADLATIDLGGVVKAGQTITLPTTGLNGSTITWTIYEDLDANATMNLTNDEVTLTEAAPDTVEVVKLQATFTMNSETLTGIFVYKIEGLTDVDRVAADKAEVVALELGGDAYSDVSVSLPTTGTNGSTITWAITTDADSLATLTVADLVIARAEGTVSEVVLTATFTKGTATTTLDVTFTMNPEFTDYTMLHAMTDGINYDLPDTTEIYIRGVVTAIVNNGSFIQDANGLGFYLYGIDDTDGILVGDDIIVSGLLGSNNGVRELGSVTISSILTSGNPLVYNNLTADELVALDAEDAGKLIKFTGLEVVSYSTSWPYTATFMVTGTAATINLSLDYFSSYAEWLPDVYPVGSTLPEVTFIFFDFGYSKNRIDALEINLTDAQAIQLDADALPATLSLDADYTIPATEYGSTYTVTTVSTELTGFIDATTTPGTLLVTRPLEGQPDAVGTVTIQVTLGSETAIDVVIGVTVKAEVPAGTITELFISEYGEGSGTNKWIEIYNGTGAPVDLSIYTIKINANANTTWGSAITLTGTLADGDVYVIYNASLANVVAEGDLQTGSLSHNGDDAVGLFKNDVLIDIFGVFGEDPGTEWPIGTADNTLVRKASVTGPTTTWDPNEWDVYASDTDTYVGSHTVA